MFKYWHSIKTQQWIVYTNISANIHAYRCSDEISGKIGYLTNFLSILHYSLIFFNINTLF